jgi:hypothetical protein
MNRGRLRLPSASRSVSINEHRLTNISCLCQKRELQTYLRVPLTWVALGATKVKPV